MVNVLIITDLIRMYTPTTFYTIYYFSNESDIALNSSTVQPNAQLTNISGILIPNSFNGQQIQVQVSLTFIGQESNRSIPTTVGELIRTYIVCTTTMHEDH